MRFTQRATSRALITAATTGAMTLSLFTGAGVAGAHVHVDADDPAPGSTAVLEFRVPGESDDGTLTTQVSVALPDVASARAEVMPGWTSMLDRDAAAGTVRSVTWTAAPNTGISAEQFALFRVSVALPDDESVSFPATQTYSDGRVVRWDQPPLPDGGEPEYPAPVLELTGTQAGEVGEVASPGQASGADDTARWLAGGALVLAAGALVLALLRRRSA